MRSLQDAGARRDIVERIRRLSPESMRRWGQMRHDQLLSHLADQLRMALGEIETAPPRGFMRFTPVRYLLVHVLPWPKGRAKAPPEAFSSEPTGWDADKTTLVILIERFGQTPPERLAATNPVFGRMAPHDWGVLSYRHLDHHLRQFSC